jgi:hypothetical protein
MVNAHAKTVDHITGRPGKSEFATTIAQNSSGDLQNTCTTKD